MKMVTAPRNMIRATKTRIPISVPSIPTRISPVLWAKAIISKKLLFFTPFLAVGFNTASTNFNIVGNYPVTTITNALGTQDYYTIFTNPVTIHETSISGMRADIGFQLNLGIRIFASATLAQYKSVNG